MLPSVVAPRPKTGELLAFHPRASSSYSQYACGARGFQRFASHPVLSLAGGLLLLLVLSVSFPVTANAQVNCLDANVLPGATALCQNSQQAGFLDITTSGLTNNYFLSTCPRTTRCYVKLGSELCGALARANRQAESYSCLDACPTGGKELPLQMQPNGAACLRGQKCCAPAAAVNAPASAEPGRPVVLDDPLGGVSLPELIGNIIRTFAGISGALALLMFVYGGIMWILSGGESKKVSDAQVILRNASIGLVLIFGAYFFTAAIIGAILANPGS